MFDRKAMVRHELANLMTTITILIADSGLKPAEKRRMEDRVRMAGMILAYENFFLGQEQPFFRENVELTDLLRVLCGVFGQPRDVEGLEGRLSQGCMRVVVNRSALADALELIGRKWASDNTPLDFKIDALTGQLTFRHGPAMELFPEKIDLLEALRNDSGSPEWGFQLALRLLEGNGIRVSFPKGEMRLQFPMGAE